MHHMCERFASHLRLAELLCQSLKLFFLALVRRTKRLDQVRENISIDLDIVSALCKTLVVSLTVPITRSAAAFLARTHTPRARLECHSPE